MAKENEEILKQTVKEEVWKHLRNYFRMSRPGFEITSNADVLNHGVGEFCLTTDTAQGMQFYKQGNMKTKSNKSKSILVIIEVQTGKYFGEDDIKRFEDNYGRII